MLRFLELLVNIGNIYNQYLGVRDYQQENYYLKEALSDERNAHLDTKNNVSATKENTEVKFGQLSEDIRAMAEHLAILTSLMAADPEGEETTPNVG